MRILTVRQPWAHAIIYLGKDVENRTRNIAGAYRGPVAIHAAKAVDLDAPKALWGDFHDSGQEHYGAIIGAVDLVDVHTAEECYGASIDRANHPWQTDRDAFYELPTTGTAGGLVTRASLCSPWAQDEAHHLVLANPRAIVGDPIPWKGALGLRKTDWFVTEAGDWIGEHTEPCASPCAGVYGCPPSCYSAPVAQLRATS